MNDFAKFELFQKLGRFGFQAIGYILTYGFGPSWFWPGRSPNHFMGWGNRLSETKN
jgi:hypothetical protein